MIYVQYVNKLLRSAFICLLLVSGYAYAHQSTELTIEIAATPSDKAWGLMGRRSMPENHGMLFIYHPAEKMQFWMFNTFMNLSIAFIDSEKVVREMYTMKAYPEKMDVSRPVRTLSDSDLYPNEGNVKQFFREHAVNSLGEYEYALEVHAGWFAKQGVKVGDRMQWDEKTHRLSFSR